MSHACVTLLMVLMACEEEEKKPLHIYEDLLLQYIKLFNSCFIVLLHHQIMRNICVRHVCGSRQNKFFYGVP